MQWHGALLGNGIEHLPRDILRAAFNPRCHTTDTFSLMGQVLPSRRDPKIYGQRHADRPRTVGRRYNCPPIRNPVGPRTPCTAPRRFGPCRCWEGLLHRINQARFVRLLVFIFILDHPLSIPHFPLFTLGFYHRTSPPILHPRRLRARCCAHNYISVNCS